MDEILALLEKEIAYLREILSHLRLQEEALLKGNHTLALNCEQELTALRKRLSELRKTRYQLLKETELSKEELEEQALFSQIVDLTKIIRSQRKSNKELKGGLIIQPQELPEEEEKKPKRRLLLEEDPS